MSLQNRAFIMIREIMSNPLKNRQIHTKQQQQQQKKQTKLKQTK